MSFPTSTSTEVPWDQQEPLFGSTANRIDDEDYEDRPQSGPSPDSLYSILNLSKDCTEEEIQKSYKRLAALLHPDRHRDPALKKAADSRFQAINHAFEVLSDPQKRVIYDELGEEGLKSELKVGPRGKTAQEVGPRAGTRPRRRIEPS